MRLHHTSTKREDIKKPKKWKHALAAVLTAGIMLFPAVASAQEKCQVKLRDTTMSEFVSAKVSKRSATSVKILLPSMREGKHLEISLPNSYSKRMLGQVSKMDEGEQELILRKTVMENITRAVKALGTKVRASFKCAPLQVPSEEERLGLPSLPKQITRGKGTEKSPYVVVPSSVKREKGNGLGAMEVVAPLVFKVEGFIVHFKLSFTLNQLTINNRPRTATELNAIIKSAVARRTAEEKVRISGRVDPAMGPNLESMVKRNIEPNKEYADYLYSH